MSNVRALARRLRRNRITNIPLRAATAFRVFAPKVPQILNWLVHSREDTNFTYELTPGNWLELANMLAIVCDRPVATMAGYISEAREDEQLKQHVLDAVARSKFKANSDQRVDFGRRLGWYAAARALKPRVIVETGVDKGLGSVLLCAALMRNHAEGAPGRYYGTDINPQAGWMLSAPYSEFGEILYGDSIASLTAFTKPIDLFINDSDHSAEYERREYEIVADKVDQGLVLGDNAHTTDALVNWSRCRNRSYLFFKEKPANHWYPGAGLGFSFRA